MNSKILLAALVLMIGIIGVMSWRVHPISSTEGIKGEAISMSTNPNPLRLGQATFVINVKDENGKPVDNASVTFDLNMTTMNMGTQQGGAAFQGNGRYSAVGSLSMSGPWRVRTTVKLSDGRIQNKSFVVNVP